MSRDEFMEATVDVWEIPPERASRVGHPAPFPVGLAGAADPHEHLRGRPRARPVHGLGHDRCRRGAHRASLHRLRHRRRVRRGRAASHRRRRCWVPAVELAADDGRKTDPRAAAGRRRSSPSGSSARRASPTSTIKRGACPVWRRRCAPSSPTGGCGGSRSSAGAPPTGPARSASNCCGGRSPRARSSARSIPSAGYAVLTVDQPAAASGGRALAAVTGRDKPVAAVVDMLSDDAVSTRRRVGERCHLTPGE